MKNIALKRISNHCTVNKFQHQRHVRVYHWLIASCSSQKLLSCNCKSVKNSRACQQYSLTMLVYKISANNPY